MNNPIYLNIIGLVFDVVGVLLVYFFAFKSNPGGGALMLESYDRPKQQRSEKIGHLGLVLLVFGFLLQITYSIISAQTETP
ncbi:MAG: hypothetical protein Q8R02_16660 [Hyphomonadaceae bacterium]|nr:hypothetical protein [Hyphomonadaceae bacterium]